MKKLWIIRHAKSSWSDYSLPDHDRPLNKRGKRDAPFMSNLINEKYPVPQRLYSSTANRALTTCREFQKTFGYDDTQVIQIPELYHASLSNCLNAIHQIDESLEVAAIFGHNPTFTYLIEELADEGPDNLPTCGCALITSESDNWSNFEVESCTLSELLYPKMFQ